MEQREQRQIVGIDGSPESDRALDWAIGHVDQLGPVQPVLAWQYPWWALVPTATGNFVPPTESEFAAISEKQARNILDRIGTRVDADPIVTHGSPGPQLVAAADQGSLLVVGSRGRGAIASGVLGSVSLYSVHHARVPVAVVPASAEATDRHGRVVVGIDGSDHSLAALRWAVDHTPTGTEIQAVHAWRSDVTVAEVAALAAERLAELSAELVASTIERLPAPDDRVTGRSIQGDPRTVLREASGDADLLVVGARGRSALAEVLLGSAATSLALHPEAPTVVVR